MAKYNLGMFVQESEILVMAASLCESYQEQSQHCDILPQSADLFISSVTPVIYSNIKKDTIYC